MATARIVFTPFTLGLCFMFWNVCDASELKIGRIIFHGEISPIITEKADAILKLQEYLEKMTNIYPSTKDIIHVYLVAFGKEQESGYSELLTLQSDWIKKNIPQEGAKTISKYTLGFHYDGTNTFQISPTLFHNHLALDYRGDRTVVIGKGFYVFSHEYLHWLFEKRGVPGKEHHCMFVNLHIPEMLATYLEENGLANLILMQAFIKSEKENCQK